MVKYALFIVVLGGSIYLWTVTDTSPDASERFSQDVESELTKEDQILATFHLKRSGPEQSARDFSEDKESVDVESYGEIESNPTKDVSNQSDLLQVVASISAPIYKGQRLQASDIFIDKNASNKKFKIYVSYNMKGAKFLGAIQVISASSMGNKVDGMTSIVLEQTVVFLDSDIHSLSVHENRLYMVGATSDGRFSTPAVLEIVKLNNGLIPDGFKTKRVDLPSFAATSITKVKNKAYVTVGDREGGVVELFNPKALSSDLAKLEKLKHKFYPLYDARYLASDEKFVYAIAGTDGGLWIKERKGEDVIKFIPLEGASVAEAKSNVEVSEDFIFVGLGHGGAYIISKESLEVVNKVPQNVLAELRLDLSVTNAVSYGGGEIYTADGEAGARVFNIDEKANLQQIAGVRFGSGMSVNSVENFGEFVVFATGVGGLKIAYIHRAKAKELISKKDR